MCLWWQKLESYLNPKPAVGCSSNMNTMTYTPRIRWRLIGIESQRLARVSGSKWRHFYNLFMPRAHKVLAFFYGRSPVWLCVCLVRVVIAPVDFSFYLVNDKYLIITEGMTNGSISFKLNYNHQYKICATSPHWSFATSIRLHIIRTQFMHSIYLAHRQPYRRLLQLRHVSCNSL